MKIRYKNLSCGYIGKKCKNSTLNSRFYFLLNSEITSSAFLEEIILFPQRIPRRDFFTELLELETTEFTDSFKSISTDYRNFHTQAFHKLTQCRSTQNVRNYLNWSYLLLRFGYFEQIINIFPENYSGIFELEIKLLLETAKIELLLSKNNPISVDTQINLFEIYLNNKTVTNREKILLMNQCIVNFYRHNNSNSNTNEISHITKRLLSAIQKFEEGTVLNQLYCSVAYRGLAMATELGFQNQKLFLEKAEELARNLMSLSEIEKVVLADNLFTCLQSVAKWHLHHNELKLAESYLLELVLIDPNDSTSHSELGFFYLNNKSFDRAAHSFLQAMKLGPPGTGMNAYYYAKCLEELGKEEDAIIYLYETTKLDKQGISAWLDLLTHYLHKKDITKVKEIASYIYNSPTLFEQLENEEILTIQNIIQ